MDFIDELSPAARTYFWAWLDRLRDGEAGAKNTAWGLNLPTGEATDEAILRHVAIEIGKWGPYEEVLYASSIFGGEDDDDGATAAGRDLMRAIRDEADATPEEREANRLARVCERIERGEQSADDVDWLEERAAAMTDEDVLRMRPFDTDQAEARLISAKVVRARKPYVCHWTGRCISAGERHLVLREAVDGEILTTRHSLLAAYLDVVGGDGSVAEMLARDDAEPLAA